MTTSPARGRVVVVGTLNVDHVWRVPVLPRAGQTILAESVSRQFGGKGANQAVAAARQGARVSMLGAVGDDGDGAAYRAHLDREGIDAQYVAACSGVATGAAHVYVDAKAENLIVVDRGANARLEVGPLATMRPLPDVLVVQLECPLAAAVAALEWAVRAGVRSVLNASPVAPDFPWGRVAVDTVIVNEHECAESFGVAPEQLWKMEDAERNAFLAERKLGHIVVTQGREPTLCISRCHRLSIPTYALEPIDTVGAGDTFAGALATQLAEQRDWAEALRHANIAAALSTLASGAQTAMPHRARVDAISQATMGHV